MKLKIAEIAQIQTGVYQKPEPSGNVLYLQARHFSEAGVYDKTSHPELLSDKQMQKHLLKEGDILFAAKGTKNFAALYDPALGLAVASSSFFVIRLNQEMFLQVLPEFLGWYINSIDGQAFLKFHAKGTSLLSIPLPVIRNMELSIPDVLTQSRIVHIQTLRLQEKKLKTDIDRLKDQLLQRQLLSFTK